MAWVEANWPAPPGVRALTTTRYGLGCSQAPFDTFNLGLRNGDADAYARANRAALVQALQLQRQPHWLRQVHGVDVVRIAAGGIRDDRDETASSKAQDEPTADAAVTDAAGKVLAILTADCLPVVLAARDGSEVAAAHAGWRGLAAGVVEATVAAMHTAPGALQAWLGPAAGPNAYEIDAPVRDAFLAADASSATAFTATRAGHWRVDLYTIARQRLHRAGVQHVHGGEHCTITDAARFYSHRRDARTGRMVTLVWRGA